MTDFDQWRAANAHTSAEAAEPDGPSEPQVTDLGHGMWMVTHAGVTRGFISRVDVNDEERFEARLRHFNPGQGPRIGQYWEFERAVWAIMAELPAVQGRDPFTELTKYASREDMLERAERARLRRASRRFLG